MDASQKLIAQVAAELIQAHHDLAAARATLKAAQEKVDDLTKKADALVHRLAILQGDADADDAT